LYDSSAIGRVLLALILAAPLLASARGPWVVEGRVVGVTDGDTITVLDGARAQHTVRLGGIDAPERGQPFGTVAKENLSKLVYDRRVEARCWKRDRYGREVCSVFLGTRDAGLEMIRDGYAWHFKEFQAEQSPEEREVYARTEESAKAARRGLWSEPNPLPPWDWRRSRKN
jgi:endonuclease YncB( thermonuclease family)